MNKTALLKDFIDAVLKSDNDAQGIAAKRYAIEKVKSVIAKAEKGTKKVSEAFRQQFMQLITESEYDVSLHGDKVVVGDKVVGRIINQLDDDSPIVFISLDGRVKKEFNTAQELFNYIESAFLGV